MVSPMSRQEAPAFKAGRFTVLVIGDVHLKPHIFDRADAILAERPGLIPVQMGDLVDDWGEGLNVHLYRQTLRRAIQFQQAHPTSLWCMGNHDFGYLHPSLGVEESGHSRIVEGIVVPFFAQLPQRIVHRVGNVIFSHAGVTERFVSRITPAAASVDATLAAINDCSDPRTFWDDSSPIWVRPQGRVTDKVSKLDRVRLFSECYQVVGHTPVPTVQVEGRLISTDTHSTYSDGVPVGDGSFAVVDTLTGEVEVVY